MAVRTVVITIEHVTGSRFRYDITIRSGLGLQEDISEEKLNRNGLHNAIYKAIDEILESME